MKTFLIILLALVTATGKSFGQKLIAVQNGGEPTFYTEVTTAITAANSGDTIFIPGGSWDIKAVGYPFQIKKEVHIIGTGHNPVSTQANGKCYLNGEIWLRSGASKGSMTGVLLSGPFGWWGTTPPEEIVNYSLTRTRIIGSVRLGNYKQSVIVENVFDSQVYGDGATDNIFSNNIFANLVGGFSNNNMFKNNLFMNTTSNSSYTFFSCFFDNNIIFSGAKLGPATDCIFNNNLFVDNVSFPLGTNPGFNNIVNQTQSSIFITQSGNTFNYTQDYHLQATCPGKNAGKDGTDIGIYGGAFPWKEGSIPFNPHFESFQIAPNTVNGNLNVNIKVVAQER